MSEDKLVDYIKDCIKESKEHEKNSIFNGNKKYYKGRKDSYRDILKMLEEKEGE